MAHSVRDPEEKLTVKEAAAEYKVRERNPL